jgi:Flp pilus assembly pilin Flp
MRICSTIALAKRYQSGAAAVEYVVIALLIVIILLASPNVIAQLIEAIKQLYEAFTVAIGRTYVAPESGASSRLLEYGLIFKVGFLKLC